MALNFEIALTVSPKTITLDREAMRELCQLMMKAADGDEHARVYFRLSGGEASVLSSSIEALVKPRWPADISEIMLSVDSYNNSRSIRVHLAPTVKEIVISAIDSEWATQMAKEVEDFVARHRNNHWIFQGLPLVVIQASVLLLLLLEGINQLVIPNLDPQFSTVAGILLMISSISIVIAYIWVVRRLFPLVVVDSGRQAGIAITRKILSWVLPLAVAALLVSFLWNYFA